MELEIEISDVINVDEDGFICFSGRESMKQLRSHYKQKGLIVLNNIINTLGERSAISQKLKQVITTSSKFYGTDQRIYIKVAGNKALGFVKVGERKLFYHDYIGTIKQIYPTAVLDIYVHQSCQRNGIGKEIFQKFLKSESKIPQKLAYDRPSEKLINFLRKHYNLASFIPQNNNYVIFDRFFQKGEKSEKFKLTQDCNKPIEKPRTTERNGKNRSLLQKINMNTTKYRADQQDSLVRLTSQINNTTFQQAPSFKETKDQSKSSFGCPWAVQEKVGFRTTSNAYGNYYRHR